MASYFDLPPQEKATAVEMKGVHEEERRQLGTMSLLSPAVTQLLDDLGDDKSNSSSEEGSISDDAELSNISTKPDALYRSDHQERQSQYPQTPPIPSSLSPRRDTPKSSPKGSGHVKLPPARPGGGSSGKRKHPHMARFHSLRSMLFSANLEDKMQTATKEDCQREETAANKWKQQHEQRQIHRPKTPEKDGQGKDGIVPRIKTRIRRMTSKEAPTMGQISEDEVATFDDNASTASSDAEEEQRAISRPYRDADEESINHSDVEELVRWVSRRDPPSDGEARKGRLVGKFPADSGNESLGESDVEDLVRYVSRTADTKKEQQRSGYSDASTESDSELAMHSSENEDAEDLVRWISHRDGPNAGPVRRNLQTGDLDWEIEKQYDSDVPELGRWFKQYDATSGESAVTTPLHELRDPTEESERGRPRSRAKSPAAEQKTHLSHEDVDELVRWVSRKETKQQNVTDDDVRAAELLQREDEKKQQIGISIDQGSLSHSDLQELVEHVRKQSGGNTTTQTASQIDNVETGDLRTLRSSQPDVQEVKQDEEEKKQQLGMTIDEGSLSHSDVNELIDHVRRQENSQPKQVKRDEGHADGLRPYTTIENEAAEFAEQPHIQASRGESMQIDNRDFTLAKNYEEEVKRKE